jgi:hypothetical protein
MMMEQCPRCYRETKRKKMVVVAFIYKDDSTVSSHVCDKCATHIIRVADGGRYLDEVPAS